MSSDAPADTPVPREVPPPPGADLPAVVDEIEERVATEVQREVHGDDESARRARTPDTGQGPSQDVVPDTTTGAADPTLGADEDPDDTTDGMPRSEPTG
ncbi:hypothetical protein [Kineococcus glutinatus]|uniref:Uncharacterized protein n=1 Tax=Kineococcus glutinatus TaxID=1070872 RepID=A0ABP9I632_9ACTN